MIHELSSISQTDCRTGLGSGILVTRRRIPGRSERFEGSKISSRSRVRTWLTHGSPCCTTAFRLVHVLKFQHPKSGLVHGLARLTGRDYFSANMAEEFVFLVGLNSPKYTGGSHGLAKIQDGLCSIPVGCAPRQNCRIRQLPYQVLPHLAYDGAELGRKSFARPNLA
jgi:hypothetical protein